MKAKFKTKYVELIHPATMRVSAGFLCVVENDKIEVPILVASWWRDGWLIALTGHSLQ